MHSYAQYCPVAKATEILSDRWTLLIVREMLGGASGCNELQRGLPGISRTVFTDRMRALERAEVIERRTGPKGRTLEYRLTPAGRDLQPVVQAIGELDQQARTATRGRSGQPCRPRCRPPRSPVPALDVDPEVSGELVASLLDGLGQLALVVGQALVEPGEVQGLTDAW
jgi:DNA-binding HxlR family transcriptional regulator